MKRERLFLNPSVLNVKVIMMEKNFEPITNSDLLIKTIRIHYNTEDEFNDTYELFNREGTFLLKIDYPIQIFNLKVKRFGFCNWGVDVTLELDEPIHLNQIVKS